MRKSLLATVGLVWTLVGLGEVELPEGVLSEEVDGITWYYSHRWLGDSYSTASDPDEMSLGFYRGVYSSTFTAVSSNTIGAVIIPSSLGGKMVTSIDSKAFHDCKGITSITVPASVKSIGSTAFGGCKNLTSVIFLGDAPDVGSEIFSGTPKRLVVSVPNGSIGWNGSVTTPLPESWCGRAIAHEGESYDWDGGTGSGSVTAMLTITNTVVHYIINSVRPENAIPVTMDTGFVNIITEIRSDGAVAVPETWGQNYPTFATKYGSNFTKALMKPTGKIDGAGNPMLVWQDYVAGTDPTDSNDVFLASVMMVDSRPVVSYSPELSQEETAKRVYKVWGKIRLQDAEWTETTDATVGNFNFFKVSVEMR